MRVVPATWMPGSNQRRHRDVIGIRLDGHPAICLRTERAAHPALPIDHSHYGPGVSQRTCGTFNAANASLRSAQP